MTSIEIKRRVDDSGRGLLSGDREVVEIIGTTAVTTKSIPAFPIVLTSAPVHLRQYKKNADYGEGPSRLLSQTIANNHRSNDFNEQRERACVCATIVSPAAPPPSPPLFSRLMQSRLNVGK